jgi:hypothetical protein
MIWSKRWAFVLVVLALGAGRASGDEATADEPAETATATSGEVPTPEEATEPNEDAVGDEPSSAAASVEPAVAAAPDPPPSPAPEEPRGTIDRLQVKVDLAGEIFAPAGRDAPPLRLPTSLEAIFDFTESEVAGDQDGSVERCYTDAAADLRIDGGTRRITLAPDARVVRVVVRGTTPSPYLVDGFLSREELDLLETPFDPLLAAAVRPGHAVAQGESWDLPGDVAAGLLAIDTVESGGLEARLERVGGGRATVVVTGIVDGAADGVPTHVTVEGSCTFAADGPEDGRYTLHRLPEAATVTVRERREAGHVAPGFDVEARVSFARTPSSAGEGRAAAVDSTTTGTTVRRRGPGRPGLVWHRDTIGRFEIVHDSGWRTIEDGADGLVMRLVDHGALVAQCSVTALPRAPASVPPTIADVERDLARSLAGQFGTVEHSSEATRTDGVRIVRVVATGRAGDLPFRWVHAVLTDGQGHRLAVTCMLEASMRERFGDADRNLVDGIFLPGAAASGPAGPAEGHPDREARLPQDSLMP